jgi:hypothetical protein
LQSHPVKPGETSVLQEFLTLWRKPLFCKSLYYKELRRTLVRFLLKLLSKPNRGFERSSINSCKPVHRTCLSHQPGFATGSALSAQITQNPDFLELQKNQKCSRLNSEAIMNFFQNPGWVRKAGSMKEV